MSDDEYHDVEKKGSGLESKDQKLSFYPNLSLILDSKLPGELEEVSPVLETKQEVKNSLVPREGEIEVEKAVEPAKQKRKKWKVILTPPTKLEKREQFLYWLRNFLEKDYANLVTSEGLLSKSETYGMYKDHLQIAVGEYLNETEFWLGFRKFLSIKREKRIRKTTYDGVVTRYMKVPSVGEVMNIFSTSLKLHKAKKFPADHDRVLAKKKDDQKASVTASIDDKRRKFREWLNGFLESNYSNLLTPEGLLPKDKVYEHYCNYSGDEREDEGNEIMFWLAFRKFLGINQEKRIRRRNYLGDVIHCIGVPSSEKARNCFYFTLETGMFPSRSKNKIEPKEELKNEEKRPPIEEKKKEIKKRRFEEKKIADKLAAEREGQREFPVPAGVIDVLTKDEIIEVKKVGDWKHASGQLMYYGMLFPEKRKRLYLFGNVSLKTRTIIDLYCTERKILVEYHTNESKEEKPIGRRRVIIVDDTKPQPSKLA